MKVERCFWLSLAAGAAAFFALTRGAVLDPRRTDWLLSHSDTATAYLGWQFFRQAPLLQLPLGANPAYGMEMGSSVVFSDSIPLLALAFKPFAALLPATFQYFGLWLAACFVLQAGFAYHLLRRFSPEGWLPWVGSLFFLLAPVWIFRLSGHFALFGQWVVLAALCLYFAPRWSPRSWIALLCAAALIHFYLLVMAGVVWIADLWQRRPAATHIVAATGATLAVMWLAGYFMLGAAASALPGFGTYRMNLLAPIDPDGTWSWLLVDQPSAQGEFEGFNYLGLGILLLVPFAIYGAFTAWKDLDRRSVVPLLAVSLLLTMLALSNRISLGSIELFSYDLPDVLRPLADLARASGRLFWPVYYLAYSAILVLAWRACAPRAALALCTTVLAVQIADSSVALHRMAERRAGAAWSTPLKSPLWAEIGSRYKRVIYVLPTNDYETFVPWAAFAADHGMAINFGYFARADAEKVIAARNHTEAAVLGNRLEADSLYVFESEALWSIASAQKRPSDVVGVLDGFRIIAPKLQACATCKLAEVRSGDSGGYPLGERIAFAGGNRRVAMAGWSLPDELGVWARSQEASLVLRLAQVPAQDLLLAIEGRAPARQEIEVTVNGMVLGTLTYTSLETRTIRIPHAVLSPGKGLVMVKLRFTQPKFRLISIRLVAAR